VACKNLSFTHGMTSGHVFSLPCVTANKRCLILIPFSTILFQHPCNMKKYLLVAIKV